MLRTSPSMLQEALEKLEQATLDHAVWRDHLVRVVSGRHAPDARDLADDAHRQCLFGRWYFEHALPELRGLQSFAMVGAEHEVQHRIAAQLLRSLAAGVPVARATIEEFGAAVDRIEMHDFAPRPVEQLSERLPGTRAKFAVYVCRNCDARYSCRSYQAYSFGSRARSENAVAAYLDDLGDNDTRDAFAIAALEAEPPLGAED